jgi:hypothetical protein
MTAPRRASFPCPRAAAWRWELAQLELGCRTAWPLPGSRIWSARAARLGEQLRGAAGSMVVAFEGYTVVGAVWPRLDRPVLPRGPFVMPQFAGTGLERRLLVAWLRGCGSEPAIALPVPLLKAVG